MRLVQTFFFRQALPHSGGIGGIGGGVTFEWKKKSDGLVSGQAKSQMEKRGKRGKRGKRSRELHFSAT